jgi:hypothetical protein
MALQITDESYDQGDDNHERDQLCGSGHLVDLRRDSVPPDRQFDGGDKNARNCQASKGLELSQYADTDAAATVSP